MTKETKWLGTILIATLILLFGGIFLLSRGSSSKAVAGVTVSQIDYSKGQKIGSDSAKVRVVEFSDLQCPACLAAEPSVKKMLATYPDQMQLIYR
ncbi:MAG: thioredoxin domain-containing protein, partial [Candidatus Curtissbacteria bacterium]|nr:thioredoxin domain-containing protein [Candidatus Curtissbacteria bacterium]